eukprot:GHVL01001165.1.p1 GENE.GHVL01001165.1~~GHVL01001165.1.p1  ORF type:complete len:1086 (+),score=195.21 GHVL01001165.1:1740-4997(+)
MLAVNQHCITSPSSIDTDNACHITIDDNGYEYSDNDTIIALSTPTHTSCDGSSTDSTTFSEGNLYDEGFSLNFESTGWMLLCHCNTENCTDYSNPVGLVKVHQWSDVVVGSDCSDGKFNIPCMGLVFTQETVPQDNYALLSTECTATGTLIAPPVQHTTTNGFQMFTWNVIDGTTPLILEGNVCVCIGGEEVGNLNYCVDDIGNPVISNYKYTMGTLKLVDNTKPLFDDQVLFVNVPVKMESKNQYISDPKDSFVLTEESQCPPSSSNQLMSSVFEYGIDGFNLLADKSGKGVLCFCNSDSECGDLNNFQLAVGEVSVRSVPVPFDTLQSCFLGTECSITPKMYTPSIEDDTLRIALGSCESGTQIEYTTSNPTENGEFKFTPIDPPSYNTALQICLCADNQCENVFDIGRLSIREGIPILEAVNCVTNVECKLQVTNNYVFGDDDILIAVSVPDLGRSCVDDANLVSEPATYTDAFALTITNAGSTDLCFCKSTPEAPCKQSDGSIDWTHFGVDEIRRLEISELPSFSPDQTCEVGNCEISLTTPTTSDQVDHAVVIATNCPPQGNIQDVGRYAYIFQNGDNELTIEVSYPSTDPYHICVCNASDRCGSANAPEYSQYKYDIGTITVTSDAPSVGKNTHCVAGEPCLLTNINTGAAIDGAHVIITTADCGSAAQATTHYTYDEAVDGGILYTPASPNLTENVCMCPLDATDCLNGDAIEDTRFDMLIGTVGTRGDIVALDSAVDCREGIDCLFSPTSYTSEVGDMSLVSKECPPTSETDILISPISPLVDSFTFRAPYGSATVAGDVPQSVCWCNGMKDAANCAPRADGTIPFENYVTSLGTINVTSTGPSFGDAYCYSGELCSLTNKNTEDLTGMNLFIALVDKENCDDLTSEEMHLPTNIDFIDPINVRPVHEGVHAICGCEGTSCLISPDSPGIPQWFTVQIGRAIVRNKPLLDGSFVDCTEGEECHYSPSNYTAKPGDAAIVDEQCPPSDPLLKTTLTESTFTFTPPLWFSSEEKSFTVCWCDGVHGPEGHCDDNSNFNLSLGRFSIQPTTVTPPTSSGTTCRAGTDCVVDFSTALTVCH